MTSFISTLSLLVLVLATSCFTLPIVVEEQSLRSLLPLFPDDFTTGKTDQHKMSSFDMRLVHDDETTDLPKFHSDRSLTDTWDTQTSTFANRESRTFDKLDDTSEPFTSTTEHSFHERDLDGLWFSTTETNTNVNEHKSRSIIMEDENDKRDFLESTTSYMPSFPSTSSAVAPEFYKYESTTLTGKYIGHLKDETDDDSEKDSKKGVNTQRKSNSILKVTTTKSKVESQDDSKELNFPIAQLDQNSLDRVSNVPNDVMHLEEHNDVVTDIPQQLSTTTIKNKKERKLEHEREPERKPEPEHEHEPETEHEPEHEHEHETERKPEVERERQHEEEPKERKPLNQGKESSFSDAKESDH